MNKSEKAGRLDRRIVIQRATSTADAYGTPTETWADVAYCWAALSYEATGSGEQQRDALHLATSTVLFTIRYRPGILATDRVKYNSEYYDILRVTESPGPMGAGKGQFSRNEFLTLETQIRK